MKQNELQIIALALGLLIGLGLGFIIYQPRISNLESELAEIQTEYTLLQQNYTLLQNAYEELESSSFTYYAVSDKLNITELKIHWTWTGGWSTTSFDGNITNVSNNPIDVVYLYVIARNPDGTIVSDPTYNYEELVDLYVGETASFSISYWGLDGDETFEVLLLY